jgi:Short C-terminal domain/Bacterial PH domain
MSALLNIALFVVGALALVISTFGFGIIPVVALLIYYFVGDHARKRKAIEKLRTVLMPGEVVLASGLQFRPFALIHRRELIAVTNSRIISLKRKVLGGFQMADIQWKDLLDARIQQNTIPAIAGSNLHFRHSNSGVQPLSIKGINSESASKMYSYSQSEEHAWEEKRRVRAMEEVRAAAGGVVVNTHAQNSALRRDKAVSIDAAMLQEERARPSVGGSSVRAPMAPRRDMGYAMQQIAKAKEMFESGIISDAEFQEMKAKIISHA